MGYALKGNIVTRTEVLENGTVAVDGGVITYVGREAVSGYETVDTQGMYIAPGFVDIHCHAGGRWWAYEDPYKMARFHLEHGTTGLLCTFYRDLGFEKMLASVRNVKALLPTLPNVLGVHLEGPYLNPAYGSKTGCGGNVVRAEYLALADTGIVRQWTFAPEVAGTDGFLRDIAGAGIVPAIGHSAASPEQVFAAVRGGAKIVTHLTDATGCSITPSRYDGTLEVSFDHAALLCDGLYYELICDRGGVHVRPEMVKLIIKTVGLDRIVGITDACTGDPDDSDVNFVDGELMGSKLTMAQVAANFRALGLSVPEVFQIASYNPACAIGLADEIGSVETGKKADLLVLDERLQVKAVYKS